MHNVSFPSRYLAALGVLQGRAHFTMSPNNRSSEARRPHLGVRSHDVYRRVRTLHLWSQR